MTPSLEARNVSKILHEGGMEVKLLENVSLEFRPGEFTAITGPSGSGKSSLLYLLGLLDAPSSGSIVLNGRDVTAITEDESAAIRLADIGFVFQFHFLLPEFTVFDNIMLPVRKAEKFTREEGEERVRKIMHNLGLAESSAKKPSQLSGGQRQRVAIARALANDPLIILADEPTGNLDTKNAANVFDIFLNLAEEMKKTVIAVTHDHELAARTHRMVHIVDGRIT